MNYSEIIKNALKEDIGKGDITTRLIIPRYKKAKAVLLAKDNFVVCGIDLAKEVFRSLDKGIKFQARVKDGEWAKKGKILAKISGRARSILSAERVALNFLCLLSGIATKTKDYVDRVKPYPVKVLDTRKTIPGLRFLEKYAVRCAGGFNHRMGLDEMVMIKDNHLIISPVDGLWLIVDGLKKKNRKIEIEVKSLKEFKGALALKPDIILLDNMSTLDLKKAVRIRDGQLAIDHRLSTKLEASGGITLKNIRRIAATGVELISVGALTHNVESKDISLEFIA